jgi:hypothetical protein
VSDEILARAILDLARRRGPGRTLCPSEVARALAADWRPLMPEVRRVAAGLVAAGRLRASQRGRPADPLRTKGPIRLGLPEDRR